MQDLPHAGGGFDQHFPQNPQRIAFHVLYGTLRGPSEALPEMGSPHSGCPSLLMHVAASEHTQRGMMEGLRHQAGQVAEVWGKKTTSQNPS